CRSSGDPGCGAIAASRLRCLSQLRGVGLVSPLVLRGPGGDHQRRPHRCGREPERRHSDSGVGPSGCSRARAGPERRRYARRREAFGKWWANRDRGGRIRAEGPDRTGPDQWWAVSYVLEVPRVSQLALTTHNGGITIEDFRGTAELHTYNGGVSLRSVGGDIRGETTNGGLRIDLDGDRWDGAGLNRQTQNRGDRVSLPAS